MTAEAVTPVTVEEWLAFEESTDERHELIRGRLVLVQGGTERHDLVAQEVFLRLRDPFARQGCVTFVHNRKVVADGEGYYPDVVVRCGPRSDPRYDLHPTWVFEVLSPSNTPSEMLGKLRSYLSIEALHGYVVVDPDTQVVNAHVRSEGRWHYVDVTGTSLPVGSVLLDFVEVFGAVRQQEALGDADAT